MKDDRRRSLRVGCLLILGLATACGTNEEWPDSPESLRGQFAGAPWNHRLIREPRTSAALAYRLEQKIARQLAECAEKGSWDAFNDLAVNELERWRALQSGEGLVASLDHIAHAADLSPEPEALFNLGLVLSALNLERTALETWEEFCRLAAERRLPGGIRRLGRRIHDRLRRAAERGASSGDPSQAAWSADLPVPEGHGPTADLADRLRQQAERGLLGKWAEAVVAGSEVLAEESVEAGLAAGRLIARQSGDWLVYDIYSSLRGRGDRDSAEAHLKLVEGLRAHHEGDYETAAATLRAAAAALAELGSPGSLLAGAFLARAVYYADVAASEAVARRTLEAVDPERYPHLAGQLHWRLGVALGTSGRNTEAIRHYLLGRDLMDRGLGSADATFVDVLLANEYRELGDFRSAWTHRIRAARVDPSRRSATRQHSLLNQMVEALSEEGYPHAARVVGREMVLHAEETGRPNLRMFAHLMRASSRLTIGDGGVIEDVEAARSIARERGLSNIELILDRLSAQVSPLGPASGEAERSLDRAVETFRGEGNAYELEPTLLARARMRAGLGDFGGARRDLSEVVASIEGRRAPLTGTARVTSLRRAQTAFDGLVRIALAENDPLAALETAERSRARYLLETAAAQSTLEIATVRSILRETPSGTAILFYAILDGGSTVAWLIADGRVRHCELTRGGELTAAARRFRRLLEAGADGEGEAELAARLYELLIAPTGLVSEAYERLVVVPDRELFRIPFAALVEPRSGRRLVETVPIVTVPSLSLLFSSSDGGDRPRSGELILVESGTVDSPEVGWLPALPGVRREVEALREVYGEPRSVTGAEVAEAELVEAIGTVRVFHFAGHSIESGRLGGSGLLVSRADGRGSLLSLDRLPLDLVAPNLVYLSSCRSMGGYRTDREGVLGLASFFFARGANAVVGTLWDVTDQVAAEVSAGFHRHHSRGDRASQALRRAILEAGVDRVPVHDWANYMVMERIPLGKEDSNDRDDA